MGQISIMAQTNMFLDNDEAELILLGQYDPDDYSASVVVNEHTTMIQTVVEEASRERIFELLLYLDTFYNRNTGSDTLSLSTGIGACRNWIKAYFDLISKENENRLVTGFLEFDASICGTTHHKNPFAILPGRDTSKHGILVIEGHFDTRNEAGCDTQGYTPGSDDNGSGTILVMEAARLLAPFTFDRTILFTTPTGEDQGLWGATAWANFLKASGIDVIACLNNDVVGGITCGRTSSPPSCPGEDHVDSTHVRIFSYVAGNSTFRNSPHKQLARLIKLIQENQVNPLLNTPMTIKIMSTEDRSGRSGDHIPFRRKGYPAIRFCSANEHGNGGGSYPDRQHSTRDVFGMDTNNDGTLDTLFVDPGYLSRNMISNAATLINLANAAYEPEFNFVSRPQGILIEVSESDPGITGYKVGIRYRRNRSHEFDEIQDHGPGDEISVDLPDSDRYFVSVAAVKNGFVGRFSDEVEVNLMSSGLQEYEPEVQMQSIQPNPWGVETTVSIQNLGTRIYDNSRLLVYDLTGQQVCEQSIAIIPGENAFKLEPYHFRPGFYFVTLSIDGIKTAPMRMIKQ